MQEIFFDSWSDIARVLIVGVLAYAALVSLLRFSGKRTLSKMNAFDLVVTVALGSTLTTILLGKDVALAEGLVAFALLIGFHFLITWLSVRSDSVRGAVKSESALLFLRGEFLDHTLRSERVSRGEIDSAIRHAGCGGIEVHPFLRAAESTCANREIAKGAEVTFLPDARLPTSTC